MGIVHRIAHKNRKKRHWEQASTSTLKFVLLMFVWHMKHSTLIIIVCALFVCKSMNSIYFSRFLVCYVIVDALKMMHCRKLNQTNPIWYFIDDDNDDDEDDDDDECRNYICGTNWRNKMHNGLIVSFDSPQRFLQFSILSTSFISSNMLGQIDTFNLPKSANVSVIYDICRHQKEALELSPHQFHRIQKMLWRQNILQFIPESHQTHVYHIATFISTKFPLVNPRNHDDLVNIVNEHFADTFNKRDKRK